MNVVFILLFYLFVPSSAIKCYFCTGNSSDPNSLSCFNPTEKTTTVVDSCKFCMITTPLNFSESDVITRTCGRRAMPQRNCIRHTLNRTVVYNRCHCDTDLCTVEGLKSTENQTVMINTELDKIVDVYKNKQTFEYILATITILTLLLQIYIVFLICTKTPASMKEYRFFLCLSIFWDMLFNAAFGLFLQPYPFAPNIAAACRGISRLFGCSACLINTSLVFYFACNLILSQYYCLTYRFTVTQQDSRIHRMFMSKKAKISILSGMQLICIFIAIFSFKSIPNREMINFYYNLFSTFKGMRYADCVIFIDNIKNQRYDTFIFMGLITFVVVVGEIISIFLVHVTTFRLRKNSASYSKNTHRLHLQFTLLLGVQLLTPFIFIIVPVLAAIICVKLEKHAENVIAEMGLAWLTLYGTTNALFTIIFVGPYRKFTVKSIILPFAKTTRRVFGKVNLVEPTISDMSLGAVKIAEQQTVSAVDSTNTQTSTASAPSKFNTFKSKLAHYLRFASRLVGFNYHRIVGCSPYRSTTTTNN